MSTKSPSIYIKQTTLGFDNNLLFDNLNLEIPAEKRICLLGPSGIGKTTLLRLVADLIPSKKSHIFSSTIETSDKLPLSNRIAYMAQNDLLMPWLSVLDNVLIGYRLRGSTEISTVKQQAISLLQKVGLSEVIYKKPNILSGGMRQRVAIVRTFIENHPVILMDEPFSSLDAISRLRLQDLFAKLFANKTVLLVTHDPLEALRIADKIYILSGSPVKLSSPIEPERKIPRDPSAPYLLTLHSELLTELTKANEEFYL